LKEGFKLSQITLYDYDISKRNCSFFQPVTSALTSRLVFIHECHFLKKAIETILATAENVTQCC